MHATNKKDFLIELLISVLVSSLLSGFSQIISFLYYLYANGMHYKFRRVRMIWGKHGYDLIVHNPHDFEHALLSHSFHQKSKEMVEKGDFDTKLCGCTSFFNVNLHFIPLPSLHVYPIHQRSLDLYFISTEHDTGRSGDSSVCYEWLRLQTFSSYPHNANQGPMRLAQAGFFYTGQGDEVQCFSCGVKYSGWHWHDDAIEIHQQISPNCAFVHGGDERNVPIIHVEDDVSILSQGVSNGQNTQSDENESVHSPLNHDDSPHSSNAVGPRQLRASVNSTGTGERQTEYLPPINPPPSDPLTQSRERGSNTTQCRFETLGIYFGKPKYPAYSVLSVRISTFQDWPEHMTQTPRELAVAGFLYAGYSDYVRCFFCGGGLRHWEANDDPWVEHARWFPECEFLRLNKGDDFVSEVQQGQFEDFHRATSSEQIGAVAGNNSRSIGSKTIDMAALPAVESVMDIGYSRDDIQEAFAKLKEEKKTTEVTAVDLLEQIFKMEDEASQTTAIPDTETVPVASNDERISGLTNRSALNKEDTHRQRSPETTQNLTEAIANITLNSIDTTSLQRENEELKEQWRCKICMDHDSSIVFLPCGHLCCCAECAPAMRRCPMCRKFIKGTVKTYPV